MELCRDIGMAQRGDEPAASLQAQDADRRIPFEKLVVVLRFDRAASFL